MWRSVGMYSGHLICVILLLCCISIPARADNWQARIYDTGLPSRVVAVDKASQRFHLFEKKSPLNLKYTFECTTGQVDGDKLVINDLRTPEGVYFVEYKIANGLDFKEYGGIAYTLNYPNPVDKLRGKTGHGIWIHSKGFGIVPRDTRGCVAIGLQEIAEIGPLLAPGTAVLLAEKVATEEVPKRDNGTARLLAQKMEQWTRAWATRSPRMFEMYDEAAYSKAMPESFAAFRANKQRLFRIVQWINIFNREVHVLEGPGYWVTWSEQFYRASNISTEGIRRLYWQQGKDGKFRIVGMEWTPRNLGMQADFLKGRLVASTDSSSTDAGSEAPTPPPLSMPENAEVAALAPQAQNAPQTTAQPPVPAGALAPAQPSASSQPQAQPAPTQAQPTVIAGQNPATDVKTVASAQTSASASPQTAETVTAPPAPALTLDAATQNMLIARTEQWNKAWQTRSAALFDFYDSQNYGKVAVHKQGRSDSFRALKTDMERRFRSSPWIHLIHRPVTVSATGNIARTSCAQFIRVPGQKPVQGERVLYWQKGADGVFRIVNSDWTEQSLGMEADYLEAVSPQISQMIAQWGQTWQAGDTAAYGTFYSPKAKQQGRIGREAIISHKVRIWGKTPPALVQLTGLRLLMDERGMRADMTQVYRDASAYEDRGTKTLLLEPSDQGWTIVEEDWKPLAQ